MHRGVLQSRRPRPGVSRVHGDGEQSLLLAEALPMALHGNGPCQSPVVLKLVCLFVQSEPGEGQMAENGKGGSPFADGRRLLPHVVIYLGTPHF